MVYDVHNKHSMENLATKQSIVKEKKIDNANVEQCSVLNSCARSFFGAIFCSFLLYDLANENFNCPNHDWMAKLARDQLWFDN